MAARQPPGPLHCSIIFSALLELQPVPGGGDPSLGLLPLTRHQHTCFWPCLALALRPFSACCTALRLPHSCRNCRCSCTAQVSVRGGLGVNAFRQLHLNIKSNLPSPFCSGALADRDEHCQCAPYLIYLERVKERMKSLYTPLSAHPSCSSRPTAAADDACQCEQRSLGSAPLLRRRIRARAQVHGFRRGRTACRSGTPPRRRRRLPPFSDLPPRLAA